MIASVVLGADPPYVLVEGIQSSRALSTFIRAVVRWYAFGQYDYVIVDLNSFGDWSPRVMDELAAVVGAATDAGHWLAFFSVATCWMRCADDGRFHGFPDRAHAQRAMQEHWFAQARVSVPPRPVVPMPGSWPGRAPRRVPCARSQQGRRFHWRLPMRQQATVPFHLPLKGAGIIKESDSPSLSKSQGRNCVMAQTRTSGRPHEGQVTAMKRSGWLTFSAVVLIVAGIMRVIDAIWAFGYNGWIPDGLRGALLGHSLTTYGWVWLVAGVILIAAGALLLGPGDRPGAEISRWVGIIAASLGAISAIFVMPYYPVWALVYIAIAIMVIYGLSAHYGEQTA